MDVVMYVKIYVSFSCLTSAFVLKTFLLCVQTSPLLPKAFFHHSITNSEFISYRISLFTRKQYVTL
jgi:hypothetical protein